MRWPHNPLFLLCLLAALSAGRVSAAPTSAPAPASAPVPAAIPDYGGRDSAPLTASPAQASPDPVGAGPAAQAGHATEALALVLAGIVGVVYALKRFGLVQGGADGRPARVLFPGLGGSPPAATGPASLVSVESSRTLPGGAMLHVVRVPGRTLLLAATGHTVTAVAEWPPEARGLEDAGAEDAAAFEEYLARAEAPGAGLAAANARLRSLLSRPKDTP